MKATCWVRCSGTASYRITNTSGKSPGACISELDSGDRVREVTANGNLVEWEDICDDYIAAREVRCVLPAEEQITLVVEYGGMPKMWTQEELMKQRRIHQRERDRAVRVCISPPSLLLQLAGEETPGHAGYRAAGFDDAGVLRTYDAQGGAESATGRRTGHAEDAGAGELRIFAGDYVPDAGGRRLPDRVPVQR